MSQAQIDQTHLASSIAIPGSHGYQQSTLDNGLRVLTSYMPNARSVSVLFYVRSGSRLENEKLAGASHFLEHMLYKGAAKYPTAKEISEAIEGIGGISNAESGKETTLYWDKVPKAHWEVALDVLADTILHSRLLPEDVERERKVITEEISTLFDSPGEWVHLLSDEMIWGDHPLGRDIGGTRDSVAAITREEIVDFLGTNYRAGSSVLAVTGALEHKVVVAKAQELFGEMARGNAQNWQPSAYNSQADPVLLKTKRTEQAHFCLSIPAYSYVHPDRYVLDILNIVLGEGMSSRLFLSIREQKGLAYDIHSYTNPFADSGSLVIYCGVEPSQGVAAIGGCLEEVTKILQEGITEGELMRAKEYWKGRTLLRLEDTRAVASWYGSQALLLPEVEEPDDVIAGVDAVSLEDVTRVARDLFQPSRLRLAMIGPSRSDRRFTRLLSNWRV